jgi:hypothetical protein
LGIPTLISLVKNAKYMLLACLDPIPKVSWAFKACNMVYLVILTLARPWPWWFFTSFRVWGPRLGIFSRGEAWFLWRKPFHSGLRV